MVKYLFLFIVRITSNYYYSVIIICIYSYKHLKSKTTKTVDKTKLQQSEENFYYFDLTLLKVSLFNNIMNNSRYSVISFITAKIRYQFLNILFCKHFVIFLKHIILQTFCYNPKHIIL